MNTHKAPAVFISHGAPSELLEKNGFHAALQKFARSFSKPSAIVVVSAHWLTKGPIGVTHSAINSTIHDFSGFPRELYEIDYPAPGNPRLAARVIDLLTSAGLKAVADAKRGLDHGAWVPLKIMYSEADIPVIQVSLPFPEKGESVFNMGKALAPLRSENILLIGSGSMTHNLRDLDWGGKSSGAAKPYAEFDEWVMERISSGAMAELFSYETAAPNLELAHPMTDHFLPIFFAAGCRVDGDALETLFREFQYKTLSMTSFAFRAPD